MKEWGKVVALKGKTAILSIQKSDECDKCRKCRPGRGEREMIAEARNRISAQMGDTVEISDQILSFIDRLLIQTGIPFTDGIIGGVAGYIIARIVDQIKYQALWIVTMSAIFMVISYTLSKSLLPEINHLKTNKLVVSSIIHKEG